MRLGGRVSSEQHGGSSRVPARFARHLAKMSGCSLPNVLNVETYVVW